MDDWRLDEQWVVGKVDDARCEDVVVVRSGLYAVIDGVTDKSGLTYQWLGCNVTPGRFAAEVVASALRGVDLDFSPEEIVSFISSSLEDEITRQHPNLEAARRPGAQVVAFNTNREEILAVGDSQLVFGSPPHYRAYNGTKAIDVVAANMRAGVIAALGAAAQFDPADDAGRRAILPLLQVQGNLANRLVEFGYPVLNGTPVPREFIWSALVPEVTHVILASDGYPNILRERTFDLRHAEDNLRRLLRVDPHCVRELRSTKGLEPGNVSFDDRAWLSLRR